MKKSCQLEPIHINVLPKDLVGEILIRMPISDAVKTSILSRKWRYAWTELPELVFDDNFCKELIKKKNKIIRTIYHVLLFHTGPLDLFELSLSSLKSCPEIDQFVLIVLKAGIKDFTLRIPKGESYRLPSSIFAYGQQLESLELRSCVFKPPTGFDGFSKLKVLVLTEVGISGSAFSSLISKCLLLEYLHFVSYTNCGRLDIIAPNLEDFIFVGVCESLCFTSTPILVSVSIFRYDINYYEEYGYKRRESHGQCMLSGRLPFVEELKLDNIYSKHMTANRATTSLVNDLYHLEQLSLHISFGFLDEVSSALRLVVNSKNLQQLTIYAYVGSSAPNIELKKVEGFSDVALDHLRKMEILFYTGSKCDLQFIELILTNSPVLEKCLIRADSKSVSEKGMWFFKELLRFQRAWPLVKIVYENSEED